MTQMTDADEAIKDADKSEVELLSFHVGKHEYSVDIMSVREIRGWTPTTSLPHSPAFVRGVINLRGTVLPVIDLDQRLGLPGSEPSERNVIIVIDVDGRNLGLRVDAVSDILSLPIDALKSPPISPAMPTRHSSRPSRLSKIAWCAFLIWRLCYPRSMGWLHDASTCNRIEKSDE